MQPQYHPESLPNDVTLTIGEGADFEPSPALIDLLVLARSEYDWPANTGSAISQQRIIDLEHSGSATILDLTDLTAHQLCVDVSAWAGNNANSHGNIVEASDDEKEKMRISIRDLATLGQEPRGMSQLCTLGGIGWVIASKIFRFVSPSVGAAVDRHASYFCNSLPIIDRDQFVTKFRREWANGNHTASRLAIYAKNTLEHNQSEYFNAYLPFLARMANYLNAQDHLYSCAATGQRKEWSSADVEMSAYYWWAQHGAR